MNEEQRELEKKMLCANEKHLAKKILGLYEEISTCIDTIKERIYEIWDISDAYNFLCIIFDTMCINDYIEKSKEELKQAKNWLVNTTHLKL